MGSIHIDNVETGMVLAEDVRDVTSRLLLSRGTPIESQHIRIFKIWGVTEIAVKGAPGAVRDEPPPVDPDLLEKVRKHTLGVFAHIDLTHPAMKELFAQALTYRSRHPLELPRHDHRRETTAGPAKKRPAPVNVLTSIDMNAIKLPEMPSIIAELNDVISTPFASATDIAKIVNKSPSLTALLLRIVNSAFYGFSTKIDSISRAVAMIGSREISGLAIGISAMAMFKDIPPHVIDMGSFIRHSLACGIIARILAAKNNLRQTEQLFVAGLLHDIGRLVLYKYFPDQARLLLDEADASGRPLCRIEKKIVGSRHTEVAKALLTRWKLPFSLEDTIVHHHTPSAAESRNKAAIVHMADIIANSLGLGSSGEKRVPPFDDGAWERLQLSPGIFKQVIRQAEHQLGSLENFLAPEK